MTYFASKIKKKSIFLPKNLVVSKKGTIFVTRFGKEGHLCTWYIVPLYLYLVPLYINWWYGCMDAESFLYLYFSLFSLCVYAATFETK